MFDWSQVVEMGAGGSRIYPNGPQIDPKRAPGVQNELPRRQMDLKWMDTSAAGPDVSTKSAHVRFLTGPRRSEWDPIGAAGRIAFAFHGRARIVH